MKISSVSKLFMIAVLLGLNACAFDGLDQRFASGRCDASVVFRGEWYDHYARGLCRLEKDDFDGAEYDFQRASFIRKRDDWMVRTYGMRVKEYFPTRELGIVKYHKKELEEARVLLKQSIEEERSERAVYFLSEVEKLLRQSIDNSGDIDDLPPTITANVKTENHVTNLTLFPLELSISDESYLASLEINSYPIPVRRTDTVEEFTIDVSLSPGENEFKIRAVDTLDNEETKTITLSLDIERPDLEIQSVRKSQSSYVVTGIFSDTSGIAELLIDGKPQKFSSISKGSLRNTREFIANFGILDNTQELLLSATDGAGNKRVEKISMDEIQQAIAGNNGVFSAERLAYGDFSLSNLFSLRTLFNDRKAPVITLKNNSGKGQFVDIYTPYFVVEGEITDNSNQLGSIILHVDGVPDREIFANENKANESVKFVFDMLIDLSHRDLGEETKIQIKSKDRVGNPALPETLTVTRQKHPHYDNRMKLFVGKSDITADKLIDETKGVNIFDELLENFQKNNRFIVETDDKSNADISVLTHVQYQDDLGLQVKLIPKIGGEPKETIADAYKHDHDLIKDVPRLISVASAKFINLFPIINPKIEGISDTGNILYITNDQQQIKPPHKIYLYCGYATEENCGVPSDIVGVVGNTVPNTNKVEIDLNNSLQVINPEDIKAITN